MLEIAPDLIAPTMKFAEIFFILWIPALWFLFRRDDNMTRLLWLSSHVWFASLLNAYLVFEQLLTIVTNRSVVNVPMIVWIGFLYIEVVLAISGYRTRQWGQVLGMGLSAVCSTIIVVLILLWR